jgi:hypothetical protein
MYKHHVRGLELKLLYAGPRALTTSEKRELLLSADSTRKRQSGASQDFRNSKLTEFNQRCLVGAELNLTYLNARSVCTCGGVLSSHVSKSPAGSKNWRRRFYDCEML